MPRKCCVGDCRCNYDTEKGTIKIHSFPGNTTECKRCDKALPNNLPKSSTKDMVVCVKH